MVSIRGDDVGVEFFKGLRPKLGLGQLLSGLPVQVGKIPTRGGIAIQFLPGFSRSEIFEQGGFARARFADNGGGLAGGDATGETAEVAGAVVEVRGEDGVAVGEGVVHGCLLILKILASHQNSRTIRENHMLRDQE